MVYRILARYYLFCPVSGEIVASCLQIVRRFFCGCCKKRVTGFVDCSRMPMEERRRIKKREAKEGREYSGKCEAGSSGDEDWLESW